MDYASSIINVEQKALEVNIRFEDLLIDKDEIGISLGYSAGKTPSYFMDMIDDVVERLSLYCQPRGGYKIFNINRNEIKPDGIYIENVFYKMDKIITGQIKKSDKIAVFVCTIGSAMELWSKELFNQGNPILGFIVDTVASAAVESAADYLHDQIGNLVQEEGLKITNRYSPGYCNWSVSDQHLLFSLLPKNFCGVSLTESALMMPVKSVSGIIGIGKEVKRMKYICDKCRVEDCTYRPYYLAINKRRQSKVNL